MKKNESLLGMRDEQYTNGLKDLINSIKKYRDTKDMTMIEIGSYAGESTRLFADEFKTVISIDPFMNDYDVNDPACHHMDLTNVYYEFKKNINQYDNIKHIRKTSDDAISELSSIEVDFVYIDGLHTYEQVNQDIKNYLPIINENGFIGGHDFHKNWQGVINAVVENLGQPGNVFSDTSWLFKKNENFINIVTPCTRPENLMLISESINIPKKNYRWIVVCDSTTLPEKNLIPENCEIYCYKDFNSISGNVQRNFALDLIKTGYVYFNDDDTKIHSELWDTIKYLSNDFISFSQITKTGELRLKGDIVDVNHIDSHNFIVKRETIGNIKWKLDVYSADGIFAKDCFLNSKNILWLDKELSIYNQLR
jgi:hypothetical protein